MPTESKNVFFHLAAILLAAIGWLLFYLAAQLLSAARRLGGETSEDAL